MSDFLRFADYLEYLGKDVAACRPSRLMDRISGIPQLFRGNSGCFVKKNFKL